MEVCTGSTKVPEILRKCIVIDLQNNCTFVNSARRERHLSGFYKLCLCLTKENAPFCVTNTDRLILIETITFCSETHMRFLNTLCWQNAEILNVPAGVVLGSADK